MSLDEKLERAANVIKAEKLAFKSLISHMVSEQLMLSELMPQTLEEPDTTKSVPRRLASEVAPFASLADVKAWKVGMTTKPGDIVLDPLGQHKYLYTGFSEMAHSDSMLYPGASDATYWAIIPEMKDFIKVYPDVDEPVVAVKKGEQWWNVDQTQLFVWKGTDNESCTTPPAEGNEWELVQSEAV